MAIVEEYMERLFRLSADAIQDGDTESSKSILKQRNVAAGVFRSLGGNSS